MMNNNAALLDVGIRVAFCEFVRGHDLEQLMADATSRRSWIAEAG